MKESVPNILYDENSKQYNIDDIESYLLMDSKKSGGSIAVRGGLGAIALGPIGLLAAVTAKKKYSVLLIMKNGTKKVVTLSESELKKLVERV